MTDKLKKVDVRRIEHILDGATRPTIPPQGTNHVDNYSQWDKNGIYKGEVSIDMENGDLYTRDNKQPVVLSKEDGILSGLVIATSGVSLREINVSAGHVRIKGREYAYDSTVDVDDATISIEENLDNYARLDAIGINGDLEVYDGTTKFYGTDFKVFKGVNRSDIPLPSVDAGYIFLGFVLVLPNQTVNDVLRPLPVSFLYDNDKPLDVSPAKFAQDLKTRILKWYPDTLYLEDTIVQHDNNLYRSSYSHVSDSSNLLTDFNSGKLTSLGVVSDSNISRFTHVGGSPTTGDFVSYFFSEWNGNTRILDAFQDISKFIYDFAPTKPVNITYANVTITGNVNRGGFTNSSYSANSNVSDYVVSDNANVYFETLNSFTPYDSGAFKTYLYTPSTSYTTSNFDLTVKPTTLPNISELVSDSNIYDLVILRNDPYTAQGYKGFYKAITANATTRANLTPSTDAYRFNVAHLSSGANAEVEFYVESVRTPNIANVDTFLGVVNSANLKYMSGIPIMTEGDTITFDYDVIDAVRYFYNHDKITTVESEILANVKNISFANTNNFLGSSLPPLAVPANSDADGEIIYMSNVDCNITANVISSSVQFKIAAYNALGDKVEYTTPGKGFMIDDVYEETGVRLYSNIGTFPSGSANVQWGNVYTSDQSEANIIGTKELQYFGGKYFYPKTDYSGYAIKYDGNNISYPNYTNGETGVYRWATFYLGDIVDEKYYTVEIRDTNGIEYSLEDGVTVSPNLKMYLRVWNAGDPSAGTKWVDINKAYISSNIAEPYNDGEAALDLSWMEGNPNYRRATFGTTERTGNVYVRIGTDSKSISFKDVVFTNGTPEENDSIWDLYTLGNIIGESYVTVSINGTDNTLLSDFLNGTTMTSNFDAQLRVYNDDDPSKGTDWLDINESYPANAFIPFDYDDPALDITYYDLGKPDPTTRKITFGPTTRTGMVQVRLKLNGDQHYANVTMLYPENC